MTDFSPQLVHDALDRLQFQQADRFLLIEQIPIGYGGQIAHRVMGLELALATGRRAVFSRDDDPPYGQTFAPQSAPPPPQALAAETLYDPTRAQDEPFLRFANDAADAALAAEGGVVAFARRASARRFGLSDDADLKGAILSWMKLEPRVADEIEAARARLGVGETTLGVHFRRGDKTVETAYVPSRHFNAAIAKVYGRWRFESLFLASDSPKALDEIEPPPGVRVIFDHEERRYDNANHKMLFRSPELSAQETFTAAKNVGLLSACGGIVGQDNAHFATIAAARIGLRHPEGGRVLLLPGRIAEIEAPALGRYFDMKRRARAFARALVPAELRQKILRFKPF